MGRFGSFSGPGGQNGAGELLRSASSHFVFICVCICIRICIRICIVFVAHLPLECIPSVPPLPHLHVSLNLRSRMDSDLQIRAVGWIQMDSDLNRRITGIPVN